MAQVLVQIACEQDRIPSEIEFTEWVNACIKNEKNDAEVSIRIVDEHESQSLNFEYRKKNKPTNVLSFPCDLPDDVEYEFLGDIVICAPLVIQEAKDQQKLDIDHWAHLTIHGTLHLLGFDHIDDEQAEIMENLEIDILSQFGFSNPYQ